MRAARTLIALVLSVLVLAPIGAQQPQPYRILVSNDDGVRAPGIAALAQILQAIGEVTIVAPSENQSGKSHSIVTSEPVWREDVTLPSGFAAIGLTATPASVMNIALLNIANNPRPDLVVTGINRGYNIAHSAYLAGTVGGARQAAMLGVPAIATSLAEAATPAGFGAAAEEVLGVARRAKQHGLPRGTFLNVNIPPMPAGGYKGYLVTRQAMVRGGKESFAEMKHPGTGRTIYWNVWQEGDTAEEGTDVWAVANGYVSVTPMKLDETDTSRLDAVRAWFK